MGSQSNPLTEREFDALHKLLDMKKCGVVKGEDYYRLLEKVGGEQSMTRAGKLFVKEFMRRKYAPFNHNA